MAVPQSVPQLRILVVAGDRAGVCRLGAALQELGYADVVGTTSASKAVRLCQEARPRLVILESCLDGSSGYEVAEKLYDGLNPQEAPRMVMVTAGCEEIGRMQTRILQAAGVPVRPCAQETLTREVQAALAATGSR